MFVIFKIKKKIKGSILGLYRFVLYSVIKHIIQPRKNPTTHITSIDS